MKESKKQVEQAIMVVAKSLDIEEVVDLLLVNVGIYSTIRELVLKLFTENRQDYFERDDVVYEAIQLIRKYCQEASKNGEIVFSEE